MQDLAHIAASNAVELASADELRSAQSAAPREAGKKFEELLASLLVKELRRGLPEGFFGSGAGADIFEGWLDEHLGAQLARDGKLGLASTVAGDLEHKRAAEAMEVQP